MRARPSRPRPPPRSTRSRMKPAGSPTRTGRSTGCRPSRQSPSSRSAKEPPARRPDQARVEPEVRFQDAARDARAVVYAGIQADPLVARLATLAADATYGQRLMARAVMNGESTDPATWRVIFPTVFGPTAPDLERAEALL